MTCFMRSSCVTKSLPGAGVSEPILADDDVTAHAAGQVHDDIRPAFANSLDHLAVVTGLHAEVASVRIAYVNVHDGRAGLGGRWRRAICSGVTAQ